MTEKVRQQIDDLAYRLRCETKRNDLPEEVIRTYAEAYHVIGILSREAEEADGLRQRVKELKEGFEGSCMACEPVGVMNKKLHEERDEARRLYCMLLDQTNGLGSKHWAERKGWVFSDSFERLL